MAATAGIDYQNRVAAWVSVCVLAEQGISLPWDLPANTTLEFIRCETEQPVDDLLVGTSDEGFLFIQVKHNLRVTRSPESDLSSALDQFARQYIANTGLPRGRRPWERPLVKRRDRLVLVTSPRSSRPIREHLPRILKRISVLLPDESLDDAAINQEEKRVLEIVLNHITNAWWKNVGAEPTHEQVRELLSLCQVQVLDVDENGSSENEARNLLRSSVLQDPTLADSAWSLLITASADFASSRSGGDRNTLHRILLNAGISVNAPPSYRKDIRRFKEYSEATLQALSELSKIRIGATTLKIARESTKALLKASEQESLLVVGEPGSGKSGALHDVVESLLHDQRDVVFFAVDRLEAKSLGNLRDEIGLQYDPDKVIQNWPGLQPGFIVVDALDAARSDASVQTIREFIADAVKSQGRWRVIASIRKFDLRYSDELRKLFFGKPVSEFADVEFSNITHLNIPSLNPRELKQIPEQSPELGVLIESADSELRDLLRVPFNLRLMGDLIGAGVALESLTPIRTQVELLERYWQERVIRSDSQGDAREVLLRRAVEKMVERRQLRVNRTHVVIDASESRIMGDLLSSNVLIEWQPFPNTLPERSILTFAHHVLFDYAVERLFLRGLPEITVERLEQDSDLFLAIRPSLVIHFHYLWALDQNHARFWELVFRLNKVDSIPEAAKIIGPAVAASLVEEIEDCEPMLELLEDDNPLLTNAGEKALRHVTGALLAIPSDAKRPLVGSKAPPWCELLERCSRVMDAPVAYSIRPLLATICDKTEEVTIDQKRLAGITARRLLNFARKLDPRDRHLVVHALTAVFRTFESDLAKSRALIREGLEPDYLDSYGFEEIFWIAMEAGRIVETDPELVRDIFLASFTREETSDDKTPLGTSKIVSLLSSQRQDWDSGRYQLAELYPQFLKTAPRQATLALIDVMNAYVEKNHPTTGGIVEEKFDFAGKPATIRSDYSHIWDCGDTYSDDDAMKILNAFEKHLRMLGERTGEKDKRQELIDVVVSNNKLAVLWRRLLLCGAALPQLLGQEIRSLSWALPILTNYDTSSLAGNFLVRVFSSLDKTERELTERAILSIPEVENGEEKKYRERDRNRLLGCLSPDQLVTDEARHLVSQLESEDAIPPNEPPFRHVEVGGLPYGEKEFLRHEGVSVDEAPNTTIQDLEAPVKEFAQSDPNASPKTQEVDNVLPSIRTLYNALATASQDGVHPRQIDFAWGILADACERIARSRSFSCNEEAGLLAKEILLEAAKHPDPPYDPRAQ